MTEDHDGWPRLTAELLSALPEHEQLLIRQHEEETIAVSKMQLADICENCHSKPQFAKTYRVLRRDLRDILQKVRARLSQPHPELSDGYAVALLRSTDAIISYKLELMAQHFYLTWGEPIENWAGREGSVIDRAGCVVVLTVIGSGVSALSALLFALCP
jgi:hypothetical protein